MADWVVMGKNGRAWRRANDVLCSRFAHLLTFLVCSSEALADEVMLRGLGVAQFDSAGNSPGAAFSAKER